MTHPTDDLSLVDMEKEQLERKTNEFDRSLGNYRGYNHCINSYYFYLEHMLRSIVLLSLPHYSANHIKAFNKLKKALFIIIVFIFIFSYLDLFEMHVQVYDKLLRALTPFEWEVDILKNKESLMLLRPLLTSTKRGIFRVQSFDLVILFHYSIIIFVPFSFSVSLCPWGPFSLNVNIVWFWCGGGEVTLYVKKRKKGELFFNKIQKYFLLFVWFWRGVPS